MHPFKMKVLLFFFFYHTEKWVL